MQRIAFALAGVGALAAVAAVAQPRQPSAACRIADSNIVLDLFLPLSRDGSGNAARGMRGTLEVHHQKVAKDRRQWSLEEKLPAQFWNVGKDFRVRLLLGTGEQLLDLVIETQARGDMGGHAGTFRLEAAEGVKVQGRAECNVD